MIIIETFPGHSSTTWSLDGRSGTDGFDISLSVTIIDKAREVKATQALLSAVTLLFSDYSAEPDKYYYIKEI